MLLYKDLNKIVDYLLFYTIAIIIIFVYPNHHLNILQSYESTKYIPKSKISKNKGEMVSVDESIESEDE